MSDPLPGTCKDPDLINPEELVGKVIEVSPGIYRYMMPYFSGAISMYAIVDSNEALIVDAGDVNEGGPEPLLDHLGFSPDNVTVFITHHHADHRGRAAALSAQGAKILMAETAYTEDDTVPNLLRKIGANNGEEASRLAPGIAGVMEFCGVGETDFPHTTISAGDAIRVGNRTFSVVPLAGHSPEGLGLFEESSRVLFTGDEVMNNITPATASCKFGLHTMNNYKQGLDFVRGLAPALTLPGHLTAIEGVQNLNAAIDAIEARYRKMLDRFAAFMNAAGNQPLSVLDLARGYYSHLEGGFDAQNEHQQASRLVKVISYAEKMVDDGLAVQSIDEEGVIRFQKAN